MSLPLPFLLSLFSCSSPQPSFFFCTTNTSTRSLVQVFNHNITHHHTFNNTFNSNQPFKMAPQGKAYGENTIFAKRKRSPGPVNNDYIPDEELENHTDEEETQRAPKIRKRTIAVDKSNDTSVFAKPAPARRAQVAAPPKQKEKAAAPPKKPGKLAKLYKAHVRKEAPLFKSVPKQQVPIGADMPYVRNYYQRQEVLEDTKKVDERIKMEMKVEEHPTDADVTIIHCPTLTTQIRITNTPISLNGEKASIEDVQKEPKMYPHISFHGKDNEGRMLVHRRKMGRAVLGVIRAENKRRKEAARAEKAAKQKAAKEKAAKAKSKFFFSPSTHRIPTSNSTNMVQTP